ncbi:YHS domain-containing protein [Burkholderia pseudomallei]|nr:YHS domain-containing protein [Burkholderia pseudomallei]VCJ28961.1 YHS domain-containing protein [Burkholderia pseudomallei]
MQWLSQNWFWIVLALGVFLLMRRGGMSCGMGGYRRGPHEHRSQEAGLPHDPVNGRSVDATHALTSIFDGRTYYFESEESRAEFNREPQRYAGGGVHRHHGGC